MRHVSVSAVAAAAVALRHALRVLTELEEAWAANEVAKALDLVAQASIELARHGEGTDGI